MWITTYTWLLQYPWLMIMLCLWIVSIVIINTMCSDLCYLYLLLMIVLICIICIHWWYSHLLVLLALIVFISYFYSNCVHYLLFCCIYLCLLYYSYLFGLIVLFNVAGVFGGSCSGRNSVWAVHRSVLWFLQQNPICK